MHFTELAVLIHFFISRSCALKYEWMKKSLPDGLTKKERQFLLDVHNHYRRAAAQGGIIGNGPQAANMKELTWNETLAKDAQQWSAVCGGKMHNEAKERGYSGQNFAAHSDRTNIMQRAMEGWADREEKMHNYSSNDYFSTGAGHFTQIMWARSNEIGCGYSRCHNVGHNMGRLVCHFMPSGNYDRILIYEEGRPCSKCDPGFGFCNDKLCARSCSGNKCNCAVDPDICKKNRGKFDKGKCLCHCPIGATGLNCENVCKNDDPKITHCEEKYCKPRSEYYAQGEALCPVSCRVCEAECKNEKPNCENLASYGNCLTAREYMKRVCPKACNLCLRKGKCNKTNFNCKLPELKTKCKKEYNDTSCQYYYGCCFKDTKSQANRTSFDSFSLLIPFLLLAIRYE